MAVYPNWRNVNGDIPLIKSKKVTKFRYNGSMEKKQLISDEDVRNMRFMHERQGKTVEDISKVYTKISLSYLKRILSYDARCNSSCDI